MAGVCAGDRACVDSGLQFSASFQVKLHQCPFSGQGAVHASFQLRNPRGLPTRGGRDSPQSMRSGAYTSNSATLKI